MTVSERLMVACFVFGMLVISAFVAASIYLTVYNNRNPSVIESCVAAEIKRGVP